MMNENKLHVVELPLSKSEANRALMMMYYSGLPLPSFEAAADDVVMLRDSLQRIMSHDKGETLILDCGNAGTVLRFLMTAISGLQHIEVILTGNERMQSRPVASLVEALRSLGATIEYKGREGYPPILLRGGRIDGGRVEVSAEQSSQFASSLLLASPLWKNGLDLHLTGNVSSMPYIDMTIDMMRKCGIDVMRNDRDIVANPGKYKIENVEIEPDWSSAAFWYEYVALSDNNIKILLKNLDVNSLQADVSAIKMFNILGVETIPSEDGAIIVKTKRHDDKEIIFDFNDCPDMFPAVIATCAGLQLNATFTGLQNLSIKESDRKQAMMTELKKINVSFIIEKSSSHATSDDAIKMKCPDELPCFSKENPMIFKSYGDHRIAMALTILSLRIGEVKIDNKDVVKKSYPRFWEEFKEMMISI